MRIRRFYYQYISRFLFSKIFGLVFGWPVPIWYLLFVTIYLANYASSFKKFLESQIGFSLPSGAKNI